MRGARERGASGAEEFGEGGGFTTMPIRKRRRVIKFAFGWRCDAGGVGTRVEEAREEPILYTVDNRNKDCWHAHCSTCISYQHLH